MTGPGVGSALFFVIYKYEWNFWAWIPDKQGFSKERNKDINQCTSQ